MKVFFDEKIISGFQPVLENLFIWISQYEISKHLNNSLNFMLSKKYLKPIYLAGYFFYRYFPPSGTVM